MKGVGAGGGVTPSCPARGYGVAPLSRSGAAPQKLYKLCIINVLNHKEFHCSSPPKNHAMNSKLRLVHLKCFKHLHTYHVMTKLAQAVFVTSNKLFCNNIHDQLCFSHHSALNERVSPFDPSERFGKGNDLDG